MSQYPGNPSQGTQSPVGSGQLVIVGGIIALIAVVLMNIYVEMRVSAKREGEVTFFQFAGDLDAGDRIDAKDLTPFQIPESRAKAFGKDAIREDSPGSGRPSDGIGFDLNVGVVEGEVLKASQFLSTGRRIGRNNPKIGERQIALSVDSEDQPADLAPGDRIDLYGAVPEGNNFGFMLVMEYVEVAAVGERRSEAGDGKRSNKYGSITINIDRNQATKLLNVERFLPDNEFRIALRAPTDTATEVTGGEAVINPAVLKALRLE